MSAIIGDFTIYPEAKAIWKLISSSGRILLHFHPNPDPDSVGSTLAMGLLLEHLGKQVTVISGDSAPDPWVNKLPGHHLVRISTLAQINLSDYDLFIILDSASPGQVSNAIPPQFPPTLHTVIIDHHRTNLKFAQLNLVDISSAATCEVLYQLFNIWQQTISQDMAINLYIGLYSDTLGFGGIPTTPRTLKFAAKLAEINPNFTTAISAISNSLSPEDISTLATFLQSIKVYFSGHVAIASGPLTTSHVAGQTIDLMRSVEDWDIVIVMKKESSRTMLSFRTHNAFKYDVSKLAVALDGGGHAYAAGATLNLSLTDARKKVLSAIKGCFPDLKE